MPDIAFTQYLRPHGRPVPVFINMPDAVAAKADLIVSAGFRFECEELTTGRISLTIHDPDEEDDVAIEVVPNGPEVPVAIERLILGFDPYAPRSGEEG